MRPRRLWTELQRRHVPRVTVAYLAGAWVIIEVCDAVFPALGIPAWALSLVTVLLALGFPLTVVLTWVFDITPHGVQRTRPLEAQGTPGLQSGPGDEGAPVPGGAPIPKGTPVPEGRSGRERGWSQGGVDAPQATNASAAPEPPFAIAVLPFADRSPSGGYRFLGDGLGEELINGLSRVEGLRVVARTSSFAFRDEGTDVREIGRRLGVGYVLEGGVQVSGTRLRLTARLVDARAGWSLWSAAYDRTMDDLLRVQEEVAGAVLGALAPRLQRARSGVVRSGGLLPDYTADVEAYTAYLRGRALWNERTPGSLREAADRFRDALARDQAFAHAHAGLADALGILAEYGEVSPSEALPLARAAAERATALAPHLAEARASLALVRQLEGDTAGAEAELRRALELNPGYAPARHRLALLLAWTGRLDEARGAIRDARLLDPLSPVMEATEGWVEYYDRRYQRAAERLHDVVARHPDLVPARVPLALSLVRLGRAGEAVALLEGPRTAGPSTAALAAYALGADGRRDDAARIATELAAPGRADYVSPYYVAVAHLGAGDPAGALAWLERALDEGAPQLIYLAVDPLFDAVRERPAFRRLLGSRSPGASASRA